MAKGVSGALTRLAKVNAAAPLRGVSGPGGPPGRARGLDGDEDDVFYLPDDLEDLSARQFGRRRSEARAEPAALPVAPAAAPRPAPPPSAPPSARLYAESPRRRGGSTVRVESPELLDEEPDEPESGGRGVGRIAQRIRRIKTALAARVGRESPAEPAPVRRGEGGGQGGRRRSVADDDSESGRTLRGSFRPKQLARVRRRLGMTQAEFARCFGLDADDVVRWEAGGRVSRAERVLLTLIMHDPEETARLVDEAMPLK